jgi:hypothetical protein
MQLDDIKILVKNVQKISRAKQELAGLKKAVGDTMEFLESNQSLITQWFAKVSVTCAIYIYKQTVLASANALSQLILHFNCSVATYP